MKELRIAFAGASGSGKTTMVKFIAEHFEIPWLNGSSGMIKTKTDIQILSREGLTQGYGHAQLIQSGHANPKAAWNNQIAIQLRRSELMDTPGSWVTDRSPVDNIVYMIMQCSLYQPEHKVTEFINRSKEDLKKITHIFWTRPLDSVEDNQSRIANLHYQEMVDSVFEYTLGRLTRWSKNTGSFMPYIIHLPNGTKEWRREIILNNLEPINTL